MELLTNNTFGYNMLVSGFILGTVIFLLFLWQAYQYFKNQKQILKFKAKTDNYIEDKYARNVIRGIELSTIVLYVAELIMFIVAEALKTKNGDTNVHAANCASSSNALFLAVAILVISYMAVAYLWSSSIIVVVQNDSLITTNDLAPISAITVSRVLKFPHVFKITYRDQDMNGNLKEIKIRYSKKMDAFLTKNGFYQGDNND